MKDKKYCKIKDHCHYTGEYRGAAHSICNWKYIVPLKVTIGLYIGSNYEFHFIIKELAEKFKKNYLFRRKHWKINNLYSSNRKRSYTNW